MVDIFDEVSDDLRGERAVRLLRRYGGLAIAAAALIVIAVAAEQGWNWYQTRRDDTAAAAFLKIGQSIDPANGAIGNDQAAAAAGQYASFAQTAPAGYRSLAQLRAAGLFAGAGQPATAAGLWNAVAADGGADRMLRDLADLLWAQHELGLAPDADVMARLTPLAAPENAYHGLAQETQALLYLHEGKIDQAKGLLTQIAGDPGSPDGVRNRADGLLAKLNG